MAGNVIPRTPMMQHRLNFKSFSLWGGKHSRLGSTDAFLPFECLKRTGQFIQTLDGADIPIGFFQGAWESAYLTSAGSLLVRKQFIHGKCRPESSAGGSDHRAAVCQTIWFEFKPPCLHPLHCQFQGHSKDPRWGGAQSAVTLFAAAVFVMTSISHLPDLHKLCACHRCWATTLGPTQRMEQAQSQHPTPWQDVWHLD